MVLICLTGITFGNIYPNGFHLDDVYRIVENPEVRYVAPAWRHFVDPDTMSTLPRIVQYRPLLPLTLSLNYALSGYEPASYHLFNLLVHMASVLLAFFLMLELLVHWTSEPPPRPHRIALVAAAIFAIHPVSGIPINYICARDLLMMESGLLASLLVYARWRRGATGRWGLALACGFLLFALLAKKNPVVAPALVLAFEVTCGRQHLTAPAMWRRVGLTGALVTAYLLFIRFGLGFSDLQQILDSDATDLLTYPLTQLKVHVFHYLPVYLSPNAVRQAPLITPAQSVLEPMVIAGGLMIASSLLFAWRARQTRPLVAFAVASYWLLLAPTSSVLPTHAMAVHYRLYPSSVFLCLLASIAVWRWLPARVGWALTVVALSFLGASSWAHNASWMSSKSLWTRSVEGGAEAIAYVNLGVEAMDSDLNEAARRFEQALEVHPDYVVALVDLGLVRVRQGLSDDGLALFHRAISLDPQRSKTHYWHARALGRAERYEEAFAASTKAAQLVPRSLVYRYQAGMDAQAVEEYALSVPHLKAVLTLDPQHQEARFGLGFAQQKLGHTDAAIQTYRTYLKGTPGNAQIWFNLGYALMDKGLHAQASEAFRETLRLRPSYTEARELLTRCEERQ